MDQPDLEALESRRLLSAGGLDTHFGANGTLTLPSEMRFAVVDMLVLPNGMLLFGAVTHEVDDKNAVLHLFRYNPDGTTDRSFGGRNGLPAGRADVALGALDFNAPNVHLQQMSDGRLVAQAERKIVRLRSNGTLDVAFGRRGRAATRIYPADVALQSDGRIVVAGDRSSPYGTAPQTFAVTRLNNDGSLDTSFGSNGFDELTFPNDVDAVGNTARAERVFVASDNTFFVLGTDDQFSFPDGDRFDDMKLIAVHYASSGARDQAFADAGVFSRHNRDVNIDHHAALMLDDGSLLVQVEDNYGEGAYDLSRSGEFTLSFELVDNAFFIADLLKQEDGKVVHFAREFDLSKGLLRHKTNGAVDRSFDASNVEFDVQENAVALKQAGDGAILVLTSSNDDGLIVRRIWAEDAPATSLSARTIAQPTAQRQLLTVTCRDDTVVAIGSLDDHDLEITGPNGFDSLARFEQTDSRSSTDDIVTARYRVLAPGGTWDELDNGVYTVRLRDRAIADTAGHRSLGRLIGTFAVRI